MAQIADVENKQASVKTDEVATRVAAEHGASKKMQEIVDKYPSVFTPKSFSVSKWLYKIGSLLSITGVAGKLFGYAKNTSASVQVPITKLAGTSPHYVRYVQSMMPEMETLGNRNMTH